MRIIRNLTLALVALFAVTPLMAQFESQAVKWGQPRVAHVKDDVYRVTFDVEIIPNWHIYDLGPYEGGPTATKFTFTPDAALELVGAVKMVKAPVRKMDDVWNMEVGYISGKASFTQDVRLKGDKATLKGVVESQACADMCEPPMEVELSVDIVKAAGAAVAQNSPPAVEATGNETAAATAAAAVTADSESDEVAAETPAEPEPAPVVEPAAPQTVEPAETEKEGSLWGKILQAIGWGFVALVTPCVFPMVPVTVSFFLKGSANKAAARFKASMFGIFIVLIYTLPIVLIVLVAQLFGGAEGAASMFNWLATHWVPNLAFFIIFIIFAASFFGAFEIVVPSALINKSDSKADKGGLIGVFFMALTLVLISFSCTVPIVSNVVVDAGVSSTVWWEPILLMLVYSAVFAIPFTLLAFVPSLMEKMKSGSWMNAVKVSLGFVEVALAFKFIMIIDQGYGLGLLSRETCLAIWITCGTLWGLYLLGVYKTKHDSPLDHVGPLRLAFAIVILTFTVWMIPGLWGAPLKPLSGYMPPMTAQTFKVLTADDLSGMSLGSGSNARPLAINLVDGKNPVTGLPPKYSNVERIHAPAGFTAFFDVDEAMAYAESVDKPVFIDITGATCVNCRAMESNVWTDPTVKQMLLYDYVMVCVYVDVKFEVSEEDWVTDEKGNTYKSLNQINMLWSQKNYNTIAQPLYVILDPRDGSSLGTPRAFNTDIAAYTDWLRTGLEKYAAK